MYPYGPKLRCKGKNHPSTLQGHSGNAPPILRLDSTGEITSDNIPAYTEPDNCSFKTMGTFFETALKKFGPKTSFNTGCLADKNFRMSSPDNKNVINPTNHMSQKRNVHQGPAPGAWGKGGILPCLAPRMASNQNMLNDLRFTPLFQSNLQQQQHYGYHPAMAGVHAPSKKYYRYRNSHPNAKHGGKINHTSPKNTHEKRDENTKPDIPVTINKFAESTEKSENVLPSKKEYAQNGAISDCKNTFKTSTLNKPCNNEKLKDSNIHVLASTASDSLKTTLDSCDILKAAYVISNVNNLHRNEEDVPVDWFDGGENKVTEDSDLESCVKNRLHDETFDIFGKEKKQMASNDNKESEFNNFQRECSVLSDIFADNSAISVTCFVPDETTQSNAKSSETQNRMTETVENEKIDEEKREKPTVRPSQNEKEEKTKKSECKKPENYSFILCVRDNKKWRSSAKKRRRKAKAKKEEGEASIGDDSSKNDQAASSSPTNKKSGCNKLAFILGFDPNNLSTSPKQSHSFLLSFSDNSGSDFSDDDVCSDDEDFNEFSCPLDLNVICSIDSQLSEGTSPALDAINKSWRIDIKVNPQQIPPRKCDKKVCSISI